jgi:hypothetical protein
MALEIKKVRYSSRYGYSVEWHEPASIRISGIEALLLKILTGARNLEPFKTRGFYFCDLEPRSVPVPVRKRGVMVLPRNPYQPR